MSRERKNFKPLWKKAHNIKTNNSVEEPPPRDMCDELQRLIARDGPSLRKSSLLVSGAARQYQEQVQRLYKDVLCAMVPHESSRSSLSSVSSDNGTLSLVASAPVPAPAPKPVPKRDTAHPQQAEYDYEFDQSQASEYPAEQQESASHNDHYIHEVNAAANGGGAKKGFSQGPGLRTIAVESVNQAKTALGNQAAAGYQAAYVVKNALVQSPGQASATAQAALAGKLVILSGLVQQVRDAKVGLQGEEMQLQQAKRAAQAAANAALKAIHQVNVIQAALNAAQVTSENANEAFSQAAGELRAQTAMVGAVRQRLNALQEQLHEVRLDFQATQAAARKAPAAAQQAQANAAEAAAKGAAAGPSASQYDSSDEDNPPVKDEPAEVEDSDDYL